MLDEKRGNLDLAVSRSSTGTLRFRTFINFLTNLLDVPDYSNYRPVPSAASRRRTDEDSSVRAKHSTPRSQHAAHWHAPSEHTVQRHAYAITVRLPAHRCRIVFLRRSGAEARAHVCSLNICEKQGGSWPTERRRA